MLAQTAENLDEAIQQVELGRKAGQLAGQSCASWDLMELSFRLARREAAEAQRLMQHIQAQHLREPGIAETLTQMLIDIGVLHPDGTPVAHPGGVPPTAVAAPGEPPAGRSAIGLLAANRPVAAAAVNSGRPNKVEVVSVAERALLSS